MRQVNRVLHDEHMQVQRLLDRLSGLIGQREVWSSPAPEAARFLRELVPVLERGLERHFRFEEEDLFPRLEAEGEGDLVMLLREEHAILLPLAAQLLVCVKRALAGVPVADLSEFRRFALEFVERQTVHIEKEEMALLPALEAALDDDQDRTISTAYQMA